MCLDVRRVDHLHLCRSAAFGKLANSRSHTAVFRRAIAALDIRSAKLAAYAKLAPAATAPFGARYLARGTAAAAFEAGLKDRIVIAEFSSAQQAIAAYESPAYKEALKALGDGAVRDVGSSRD